MPFFIILLRRDAPRPSYQCVGRLLPSFLEQETVFMIDRLPLCRPGFPFRFQKTIFRLLIGDTPLLLVQRRPPHRKR